MKKLMYSLAMLTCVSSLVAEDIAINEKIIGVEIGSAQIEADTYGPFGEESHRSAYNVEYGLRLGAQNDTWRTLLIVNYFDSTDDDQKYYRGLGTFDYLLMQDSSFKPFIGVNIGYMNYKTSNPNGNNDENSFIYGGQAGVLFRVADEIELDLSYRYSLSSSEYVNNTGSILFGLNYIFK
ncbi:outer membrane beta-barrel protein [Sulfurovum sp. NBC37-1]|uniref:outer membrane beta-barrel protein n=1 Tax=Sulfurovum sp. (strain NBC37-1) TaxID=387093 RepID=UPI0001587D26|nr:outer membrane beta-barrel protein [Sulfurovum sp. NBC37-1]BAF72903.1 hypothetical protein SUN_1959 [Sulfurovum sp. NBC37-1]